MRSFVSRHFNTLLAASCLLALSLLYIGTAHATKNLPTTCAKTVASGTQCATADYQCIPGKAGLYTATPSSVWTKWEDLAATDDVRVWANDLVPGTCAGGRVTVRKADAASEVAALIPVDVSITWSLPSTYTNNDPLTPQNPIAKVELVSSVNYSIPDSPNSVLPGTGYTVTSLAGTATSFKLHSDAKVGDSIYVRARVILKNGETSTFSAEANYVIPARVPNPPGSMSIANSPPADTADDNTKM